MRAPKRRPAHQMAGTPAGSAVAPKMLFEPSNPHPPKESAMNNHLTSAPITQAAKAATQFASEAIEVMGNKASQAKEQLQKAAGSSERIVKKYPLITAGTMLGLGVMIGVGLHRVFAHRSTLTDVLGINDLTRSARAKLKGML